LRTARKADRDIFDDSVAVWFMQSLCEETCRNRPQSPDCERVAMRRRKQPHPGSNVRGGTGRERDAAKLAGLQYGNDSVRGIRRDKRGGSFGYVGPDGKTIRDRKTLARIQALVIPPAWKDVWICCNPNGHLQATGRDARGRKQYRYHPRWREIRDENKYEKLISFARALPRIRRRVATHLRRRGLPREKVLAAVVKLLETTLIRVGNEEYAKSNNSFGLTTMRDRHAEVAGSKVCMEFNGKSGVNHEIDIRDPEIAKIIGQCQDLPGQELFQYVDTGGAVRDIGSTDVNEYLREISGQDFTAKDFRTWAGTALAAQALQEFEDFDTKAAAKRNVTRAIERVAERLGNTKAVCRKCYVHPAVIDAYMDRSLVATLKERTETELRESLSRLSAEEAAVLALLQQRMERQMRTDANHDRHRKQGPRGQRRAGRQMKPAAVAR
jgi:DNA topoisomerase-1